MSDGVKATCTFVAEDVQTIFDIPPELADEWLANNRRRIEERMCQAGFEAIETLGSMDDLPLIDEETT